VKPELPATFISTEKDLLAGIARVNVVILPVSLKHVVYTCEQGNKAFLLQGEQNPAGAMPWQIPCNKQTHVTPNPDY
jgi:hypothetical protein